MRTLYQVHFALSLVHFSVSIPKLPVVLNTAPNPVGNYIASYFYQCLLHIVYFSGQEPFNYETSNVPSTFHTYPSSHLSNHSIHDDISTGGSSPGGQNPHNLQKIQNFKCMLTMMSFLEGKVDLSDAHISLDVVLPQDHVLGHGLSFLPQYVVVFAIPDDNLGPAAGRDSFESFAHGVVYKFFHDKDRYTANLPALFALQVYPQYESKSLEGFLYCWYCAEEYELTEFSCSGAAHCPAKMMGSYLRVLNESRQNIPWMYLRRGEKVTPPPMDKLCPLTLAKNSSCLSDEIEIMTSFLTEGSNRSVVSRVVRKNSFHHGFPYVTYGTVTRSEHPVHVILVGRSVQFRFITADGIESERASFATFAAPFSAVLWLAIGSTALYIAMCMAAMSSLPFMRAVPTSVARVLAPLVDKVTAYNVSIRHFSHPVNVVMTFWILGTIVLTNCYKSIMKSSYMIEEKYILRWKSFKEIENFTFIHAESIHNEFMCKSIRTAFQDWREKRVECKNGADTYDQQCVRSHEHLFWQYYCFTFYFSSDERFACQIFHLALDARYFCDVHDCPQDAKFKEWMSGRSSLGVAP